MADMEYDSDSTDECHNGIDDAGNHLATVCINVPFNNCRDAEIARNSLQVDQEPKRSGSKKIFTLNDNVLKVEIISPDVRQMRSAVCSFMDLLNLVCKTIDQFGPAVPQVKKLCT